MATATVVRSVNSPAFMRIMRNVTARFQHDWAMLQGEYLEAARLRAQYSFLRLAGPKGALP